MNRLTTSALLAAALALPCALSAAPLQLTPANPQPSGLNSGLSVIYAFPSDVKSLDDAREALAAKGKAGPALVGLSYEDKHEGSPVMTAKFSTMVAADISGYVRFDAPGVYTLNVLSNDGAEVFLGGQEIAYVDDRRPCDPVGEVQVNVPEAGWYELQATYFQRMGTSCLMMEWGTGGKMSLLPNEAYGH